MLEELPEKYRQVITLFYLEEKAYEEMAAMLGNPFGDGEDAALSREEGVAAHRRTTAKQTNAKVIYGV